MSQDHSGIIAGEMALVSVVGVFAIVAAAPLLILLIVRTIELAIAIPRIATLGRPSVLSPGGPGASACQPAGRPGRPCRP